MDILIGPENLARIGDLQTTSPRRRERKIQTSSAINCFGC